MCGIRIWGLRGSLPLRSAGWRSTRLFETSARRSSWSPSTGSSWPLSSRSSRCENPGLPNPRATETARRNRSGRRRFSKDDVTLGVALRDSISCPYDPTRTPSSSFSALINGLWVILSSQHKFAASAAQIACTSNRARLSTGGFRSWAQNLQVVRPEASKRARVCTATRASAESRVGV